VAEESVFASLREKANSFLLPADSEVEHVLVGKIHCLYAEVGSDAKAEEIIQRCLRDWFHNDDLEISICPFPWGWLGTPTHRIEALIVLAPKEDTSIEAASWFINFVLPRLALTYRKIELDYTSYEVIRPEIEKAERALARALKGRVLEEGRESDGNLDYLERRTLRLSNLQDALVEKLGGVQQQIISMETNVENLKLVLKDKTVESQYQRLWTVFGESSTQAVKQVKVDRNYFDSRKEEATLALNTLGTLVDVERGKFERRLVIILGIVGLVMSLVDGFSSELPLGVKIAIVAVGVIAGAIVWLWRRKLGVEQDESSPTPIQQGDAQTD